MPFFSLYADEVLAGWPDFLSWSLWYVIPLQLRRFMSRTSRDLQQIAAAATTENAGHCLDQLSTRC